METVARLDALDEILIRGGLIDEVDRCLIDGEKVGRGEDANIRDRRLGSDETGAVAVDRHAAQDIQVDDVLAEEINGGFGGFRHVLHEELLAWPGVPVFRLVVYIDAMDLALADASIRTADGEILHRAAEAAHGMSFEMGEDDHRVIVHDVAAHGDCLEMLAAADRKLDSPFFVHDIDRAEGPAIHLQGVAVHGCRVAVSLVERIRFYDRAVLHLLLKGGYHVTRQDIRPMLFTGMQLDGYFAIDGIIDPCVERDQVRRIDHAGEVHLGAAAFCALIHTARADDGSLFVCFHIVSSLMARAACSSSDLCSLV